MRNRFDSNKLLAQTIAIPQPPSGVARRNFFSFVFCEQDAYQSYEVYSLDPPNLTKVNKQIRAEALPIYYQDQACLLDPDHIPSWVDIQLFQTMCDVFSSNLKYAKYVTVVFAQGSRSTVDWRDFHINFDIEADDKPFTPAPTTEVLARLNTSGIIDKRSSMPWRKQASVSSTVRRSRTRICGRTFPCSRSQMPSSTWSRNSPGE